LSQQLGTTDEQWQALYGLGRLARSAHRDEVAYTHFREAISEIESVRAERSSPKLRSRRNSSRTSATSTMRCSRSSWSGGMPRRFFEVLERARARTFQDRLAVAQPTLAAVQPRLEAGSRPSRILGRARAARRCSGDRDASGIVSLPAVVPDLGRFRPS